MKVAAIAGTILTVCIGLAQAESPYVIAWGRQFGTSGDERYPSVAVNGSAGAYVTASTPGSIGNPISGDWDGVVRKYSADGGTVWTKQFGTPGSDLARGVVADDEGNVYITGATDGDLAGTSAGGYDGFLLKYDAAGGYLWGEQVGTPDHDTPGGVALDAYGGVYVAGTWGVPGAGTGDIFVEKFSIEGSHLWHQQIGAPGLNIAYGTATDPSGNVYVSGHTKGDLAAPNEGDWDAVIVKYDTEGNLLWAKQVGTVGEDVSFDMVVDGSGNAYLYGSTEGDIGGANSGGADMFLRKYDPNGNVLWTRQHGGADNDWTRGAAIGPGGNIYVTGGTLGTFGGPSAGGEDAFLAVFSQMGDLLWTLQWGTPEAEWGGSVSVDGTGAIYIAGVTYGSLYGVNQGERDIFLAKVPEPVSVSLLGGGAVLVLGRRRRDWG